MPSCSDDGPIEESDGAITRRLEAAYRAGPPLGELQELMYT